MLDAFHPAVARWFARSFAAPTAPQLDAWPAIQSGRHALIAAPTGSGKTLAAFLSAIDSLVRQAADGRLEDKTQVVYVSPLKALSNDVQRNLQQPLQGAIEELEKMGLPPVEIRAAVRTGDTDQSERAAMRRRAPHILVTTPESLYLLLTSESGRRMLASTRSVIVDEIHAVAGTKRGAHLALTLERLAGVCEKPLQRTGLSATQKPIEEIARFLVGGAKEDYVIVDSGHSRERDLALILPDAPLEAVMSAEVWESLYEQLATLANAHKTTLVFANTRRMVERVTRHLSDRLGEDKVAAHHGSLSKELRLDAEQRLKFGQLKVLVATASLELGIDIGDVDLVCQLSTPRSIAAFLQRVGRANHSLTGIPKGRLFPLSRDDLVECAALLDAVRRGELDRLHIPQHPLDVLAQQIVAEVACREYDDDELFALVTRAYPYRNLTRKQFDDITRVLAEGYATRRGRRSAYLHRDAVNKKLRPRKGARLTALTCGGAIPDNADYQVILEPTGTFIGTLNEDFAIESSAGDIFQLGNASYKILRVEASKVRVEDAKGQPPTLPFWFGEAPARTDELSVAVSRLRAEVEELLSPEGAEGRLRIAETTDAMVERHGLSPLAAEQIVEYLATAKAMLGALPTQDVMVFERFFDEAGGMQFIIHSPFGARINKAFGLALRKRFCRSFNFELQAAATEDAIILSLGETHSFPLDEVIRYLHSRTVKDVLVQAVLDAPLFGTRWRWNATISLAIKRSQNGKKTPPPILRILSEDLSAVVFPDQLACLENIQGEREIPDHPLVEQTLHDCLHEAMDIDGLIALLGAFERGEKRVVARDLPHPSPLAQEILNARPYAYLDDAPLEERRTRAVASRRWLDPETAEEFGKLDPEAIRQVREEAWPGADTPDELHDAMISLGAVLAEEGEKFGWTVLLEDLIAQGRAVRATLPAADTVHAVETVQAGPQSGKTLWIGVEQIPQFRAISPQANFQPDAQAPAEYAQKQWAREDALVELTRGRLQGVGPTTATEIAQQFALQRSDVERALIALEAEGFVLRGSFTDRPLELEWCERRLLARIHRYTIKTLRAEIEPVPASDFMRFLLDWQGVTREPRAQGVEALSAIVEQLEGFEPAAGSWEQDVLAARMHDYERGWLDTLCIAGRVLWTRLTPPKTATTAPVRATPMALLTRKNWPMWQTLTQTATQTALQPAPVEGGGKSVRLSHAAQSIAAYLQEHGASFFDEIVSGAGVLKSQAEDGLGELVAAGRASSDSFNGLRALLVPNDRKRKLAAHRRVVTQYGLENAGRWSLIRREAREAQAEYVEQVAWILLRRYGVVFRRLLAREPGWMPPWYVLLKVYRRLEAQGLIRGGRFVGGFSGEQYALPDAVNALRAMRRQAMDGKFVSLSAADPLNLVGILTPDPRVPALASNRILLRDGVPVAVYIGGETRFLETLDAPTEWAARNALLRQRMGTQLPTAAQ